MFLAAAETATSGSHIDVFDFFVLAFTLLIAIGVVKSMMAKQKNLFAIGFGIVSLLVFLIMDYGMMKTWF